MNKYISAALRAALVSCLVMGTLSSGCNKHGLIDYSVKNDPEPVWVAENDSLETESSTGRDAVSDNDNSGYDSTHNTDNIPEKTDAAGSGASDASGVSDNYPTTNNDQGAQGSSASVSGSTSGTAGDPGIIETEDSPKSDDSSVENVSSNAYESTDHTAEDGSQSSDFTADSGETGSQGSGNGPQSDTSSTGAESLDSDADVAESQNASSKEGESQSTPQSDSQITSQSGSETASQSDSQNTSQPDESQNASAQNTDDSDSSQTSQSQTAGTTSQSVTFPFDTIQSASVTYTFKKLGLKSYDDYVQKGYNQARTLSEMSSVVEAALLGNTGDEVIYFVSPYAAFDDVSTQMSELKSKAADGNTLDRYARDIYLYNRLSLDYQMFNAKGIVTLLMNKIEDSKDLDASIYAVYFHSYETGVQMREDEDRIAAIVGNITAENSITNDFEAIYAVHNYLCDTVTYAPEDKQDYVICHSAYGALHAGIAVCDGYAKTFKLILNKMGIECDVVYNDTHAWNTVKLDDAWYMVDLTCDDSSGESANYTTGNYCTCFLLLGQDMLLHTGSDVIVDGFAITEQYLASYGYANKTNTQDHTLAINTYNHTIRVGH